MNKRIILAHATGPLAGLNQFMGCCYPATTTWPKSVADADGKTADFVKTMEHYVLYRETTDALELE